MTNELQANNTLKFQKELTLSWFIKQGVIFIKRWRTERSLHFQNKENVKAKPIGSYKPGERYQADIVLLPNQGWNGFRYIFAIMDRFAEYGWVVPLNDSKAEAILGAENAWSRIIFLIDVRPVTEESSKQYSGKYLWIEMNYKNI